MSLKKIGVYKLFEMVFALDSYRVLARKYRPKSFEDLIGQDLLVKILKNAFQTNRIAHAFLLTGIRGVGKTTTARIISSCLNCIGVDGKGGPTINPCGLCENCTSISNGNNVDVFEIDAASRTGVADVREIIDSVKYKPASARYKVFIIDEVHMLSNSAFNALLKTLEEPPQHTKFIFATTEIQKIPVTVISRCQRYDLNRVSPDILITFLTDILKKENKVLEKSALSLVIRASEGSVRDALSILDQIILGSDGPITVEEIQELLGLSDRNKLLNLFEYILEGNIKESLSLLRSIFKVSGDPISILQELAEIIHWITSLKVAPDLSRDLLFTEIEKGKGSGIAENIQLSILIRMWQVLNRSLEESTMYSNQLAHAEMAIIRLTTISDLPTNEEIIREFKKLSSEKSTDEKKKEKSLINKNDEYSLQWEAKDENDSTALKAVGDDDKNDILESPKGREEVHHRDILDLLKKGKEISLLVEVEKYISFVSCSFGKITIEIKDGAANNFLKRFVSALEMITGFNWEITVIKNSGMRTVKEQALEDNEILEKNLWSNTIVKSVLEVFPGSDVFFDDKESNL